MIKQKKRLDVAGAGAGTGDSQLIYPTKGADKAEPLQAPPFSLSEYACIDPYTECINRGK
jgi:hypothetical protein